MDSALVKIKIKKYLSQYEYLLNEYEETEFMFEKYKEDFYKECPKVVVKKEETVDASGNTTSTPTSTPTSESATENTDAETPNVESEEMEFSDKNKEEINKFLNKLYKKLSLKTHPDKVPDHDDTNFRRVKEAYNARDILALFLISRQLNLDIDIDTTLTEEDFSVFDEAIDGVKKKINGIKETLAWNWASADDTQKKKYREIYKF